MKQKRLKKTLIGLCSAASPSGRERKVAELIRTELAGLPVEIEEDDAGRRSGGDSGNLCLRWSAERAAASATESRRREPVFLAAHMDTVERDPDAEPAVIEEGGVLRTEGRTILGGDDKTGAALIIELFRSLYEAHLEGRVEEMPLVEAVFTVREEQGARGAQLFDAGRLAARNGFVLDGESPPGTVIRRAPGKYRYELTVEGKKAHAALEPEEGVHALRSLAECVLRIPSGRLDDASTANIGILEGGEATNVIPDAAVAYGEVRSLEAELLDEHRAAVEAAAAEVERSTGARIKLRWEPVYEGYSVDEEAPCIRHFRAACSTCGLEPQLLTSSGGGDANVFNNRGKRAVVFGVGMHNVHSYDEYVDLDELQSAAGLLYRTVFSGAERE